MAKAKAWLLRLFLSLWVGFQVQAADPSETFDQANKLYEEGKYAEAAGAYEKMIQEGNASAALYFNLGNTCFKNGQIGRAIVNYRLAKRLAPRDPDVRANLQFARDSVSSGSSATNRWLQRWLGLMTLNELTVLAGVAIWFWFLLLVLGEMRVELKKSLQGYTATVGVISGLLALWLGVAAERRFHQTQAVIIVREAVVRYGPLEESQSFYTLRDGAEMAVLDRKDGWLQVIDAAKRTGWVQARQVASLSAD
ncbi:MAG: tetratricopeptide repeat protein [Verrucomicrobiota bacterium]